MAEIDILDFFKTGSLSGVRPGMARKQIENILGKADGFYPGTINDLRIYEKSPIWVYGGIEFSFDPWVGFEDILKEIYFKPFYLFRKDWYGELIKTKVHRWVFKSIKGPKIEVLLAGLNRQKILFQDTGLEWVVFNEEIKNFQVIEYQEDLFKEAKQRNKDEEAFGTIVLKNGVQVRYDDTGAIQRVTNGVEWMIKGKEQYITWE